MSKYRITLDGKTYEMEVELMDGSSPAPKQPAQPKQQEAQPKAAPKPAPQAASGNTAVSPMPGTILKVNYQVGDAVKQGSPVLVLEAMKMENEILAAKDGKITSLFVKQGDSVQGGAALFEIGE